MGSRTMTTTPATYDLLLLLCAHPLPPSLLCCPLRPALFDLLVFICDLRLLWMYMGWLIWFAFIYSLRSFAHALLVPLLSHPHRII